MTFWGKIIGGICGWMLFGPVGLLIGIIIGHMFDRGVARQNWHFHHKNQAHAQQVFFNSTFLVMGHIAKTDGRVSEAEIAAARSIMGQMNLNESQRQQAMDLFAQGKQPNFNLKQTVAELLASCHHNKTLLRLFVELQMRAAQADGHLSPEKQQALQLICQQLGVSPINFAFFENFFNQYAGQQHSQQQRQHYYRQPHRSNEVSLSDSYILLNVSTTATDAEIKRAYRKMMSQHHPDKLMSKGLPEEMVKLASEKTQKIKAAYERICAARGIK